MTAAVDPMLGAIAKAIYGDVLDPGELAKAFPDPSDVHVAGSIGSQQPQIQQPAQKPTKKKLLAAGLLAGAAIEATAAKDTLPNLAAGIKAVKPAVSDAAGAAAKLKALKPLAVGPPNSPLIPNRPILPVGAGPGTKTAIQAGNFGVGLGAASELLPKKNQQVGKALRLRLRPLNPEDVRRVVSLKARRPAGSPVGKRLVAVGEIAKLDSDKRQVFGWANVSEIDGREVLDRQGDIIPIDELEKAAYDYVLDCRVGGDQHARLGKGFVLDSGPKHTATLIESMVFTPDKIEKMGLPTDFPRGWWVGLKVHDEPTWQLIKSGQRTGFSLHGTGSREPVSKGQRADELKRRTNAALHPPPVRLRPVQSSAISAMGYQPQTRRLAYALRSRPDAPYEYRAKPARAKQAEAAPSLGRYYATQVRGKVKRATRYTLADRARLFITPPENRVGKSAEDRRRTARKVEVGGQLTAGAVGSGFGAAKLRDAYAEDYPASFARGVKRLHRLAEHPNLAPGRARQVARVAHAVEHGKPGFKPLAAAVTAGGVATAAHRYQQISGLRSKRKSAVSISPMGVPHLSKALLAKLAAPIDADQALAEIGMGTQKLSQLADVSAEQPAQAAQNAAALRTGATTQLTPPAPVPVPPTKKKLKPVPGTPVAKADWGQELGTIPRYAHVKGIGKVRVIGYHGNGHFRVLDRTDTERLVHRDHLQFLKKGYAMTKSAFGVEMGISKSGAPARYISDKARAKAADKGDALPSGAFPIQNRAQLDRARKAVGRAKPSERPAVRRLIRRRAKELDVSLSGSSIGKSAFGVPHEVEKAAPIGTRGDKRNTKYAAATLGGAQFGGFLVPHPAALAAGGALGASSYYRYRHSPEGAKKINASRARSFARRKAEKEIGPTLRQPVTKSAFGVDHEIEKFALPFTAKAKRQRQEDTELARTLPRRQAFAAATVPGYTAMKAPKGKKLAATKTAYGLAFSRPQSGGRAAAAGHAKAKREHGF